MPKESSELQQYPSKFTKSMFVDSRAFVKKSLSPVDHLCHSVADLRFASFNSETLESRLQAITKKFDNGSESQSTAEADTVEDVAKPQYMAKSFAGLLATASMCVGMDELGDEEDEDEDELGLMNDAASVFDSKSQTNRTLFEVSVEMNTDAVSQLSTDSKSRKEMIRERLIKKFLPDNDEKYIEEYPCWLLRDIMIQGHVYLTDKHLFFFAFIPNFESEFNLTGSLSFVNGQGLSKGHRYWVVLKGHTLSFHNSSTELYFPLLNVDLREISAVRIDLSEANSTKFELNVNEQSLIFKADSFHSARHWVSSIKKQMFAFQHSETNTMTVKIPLQNILDLEETNILDRSGTLRIRALENSSTYAVDEYFFVFFKGSAQAMKQKVNSLLKDLEMNGSQILIDFNNVDSPTSSDDKELGINNENSELDDRTIGDDKFSTAGTSGVGPNVLESGSPMGQASAGPNSRHSKYPRKVKKKLKSMAGSLKIVSPSRLPKLEDDIIIEHYSPGLINDQTMDYDKDCKSIISRFTPKKFQNVPLMWAADPVHFNSIDGISFPLEDKYTAATDVNTQSNTRFRHHFSFDDAMNLIASYHGYLNKNVPIYGKIYVSDKNICFRSLLPGISTKMVLPLDDVENCYKETGFRFGYFGLVIVIKGHEELFLEFGNKNARDDCEFVIMKVMDIFSHRKSPLQRKSTAEVVHRLSEAASIKLLEEKISEQGFDIPLIVEKNPYFTTVIKPSRSYKFGLLTIGSRGDVQPYIALAKGLKSEGHEVIILTHSEFKNWIVSHGIGFREISGNPAELISLMVQHGSMNMGLLRDASTNFSSWISSLLETAWEGCQGIDILIESPSAMAGIHIAEALKIPYFRAFTMPWTRTRAYPHAFIVPDQKRGGNYNYFTHVLFENIFWKGISGKVNEWREKALHLPRTNLVSMQQNRVPFLYNVSPIVFPPSVDFNEWIKVTGYWFLDEKQSYTPPSEFLEFIKKARELKKKLVYIGFGSIVVNDPDKMTETVIDAVGDAGVYCILNKGWSNRIGDPQAKKIDKELPHYIYNSGDVPHDWLFSKIDATVHHGGSGTTGASLRAGLPTIIKPFFGDQFFYAGRVDDVGAGVALKKLNRASLAKALKEVTTNTRIIQRAKQIGESISKEHGVATAIGAIYSELGYARSLIKARDSSTDKEKAADMQTIEKSLKSGNEAEKVDSNFEESGSGSGSNDGSWLLV
ncbi:unnamed protein product [Kluyveromyces dobzhanskii CBS 2104]|uniref:Sterol 3-beta-glucosyltransferase n=1 Tax=Kluyveromyces dobzhanskii CBS 2104 TaxID=1427455 RepID=A0A0A8L3K9_9SACH|nr:unnamed protein product [Kluyveromyces dobzhanskii CBS 2104]